MHELTRWTKRQASCLGFVLREPKILDVVDPVFAAIRSTIHQYLNNPALVVFAWLRAAESSRSRHLGVLCTRRTLFLLPVGGVR